MHFDYKIETLCSVMLNMKYKVEISSYKPSARNIRHLVFFPPPPPHFHTISSYHHNSIHTADHRELSQSHTS